VSAEPADDGDGAIRVLVVDITTSCTGAFG